MKNAAKNRVEIVFSGQNNVKKTETFPKIHLFTKKEIAAPKSKLDSFNTKQYEQLNLALRKSRHEKWWVSKFSIQKPTFSKMAWISV